MSNIRTKPIVLATNQEFLRDNEENVYRMWADVEGHESFDDGERVFTSKIHSCGSFVETNNTIYLIIEPELFEAKRNLYI